MKACLREKGAGKCISSSLPMASVGQTMCLPWADTWSALQNESERDDLPVGSA